MDAGGTRRDASSPGLSLSAGARLGWRTGRVGLGAQWWSRGGAEVLSLAPSLDVDTGPLSWRASYRFYGTDTALGAVTTQSADVELGFAVAGVLHLTLGGERQWGERLRGTRLRIGLWRAF